MTSSRSRIVFMFAFPLTLAACNRDSKSSEADSAKLAAATHALARSSSANTGWDATDAGPVMILPVGDNPLNVAVVLPNETDSTLAASGVFQLDSLSNTPIDLFGPKGSVGQSNLKVASQRSPGEGGCVAWPVAELSTQPPAPWKVGFVKGKATAMQLDSIDEMSQADSTSVVTELARLASAASVKSDPGFQGLPFIVQRGYRTSFGKTSILIGSIQRKINEEATPRIENLLLVAERPDMSSSYVIAFQSRTSGIEDEVRTNAITAAIHFVRTNRPALVVSFEYDDGGQVALLERVSDHNWRLTWRSAYTGC